MASGRVRHPNADIEKAVQYAEAQGWTVRLSKKGQAWGRLFCPHASREGCIIGVYSTPKNPDNHARHIRNQVDKCSHPDESDK